MKKNDLCLRQCEFMKFGIGVFCLTVLLYLVVMASDSETNRVHIRLNQLGYLPGDTKIAVLFSTEPVKTEIRILDAVSGEVLTKYNAKNPVKGRHDPFPYYYKIDFSAIKQAGTYLIAVGIDSSASFKIDPDNYHEIPDLLLEYMRQQRCGYNPFWDEVCHQRDGRTLAGPLPDSTFIDASGGWHDAGDDLKYLLTSSYVTGVMLMAYLENPEIFSDKTDRMGQPVPNGIPDILDEARWGLDWMHKLHPRPKDLYHQVADDRDHIGWKFPWQDSSDYGWGPLSYRVVYYASGKPQGLGQFKSNSDGVANLAGRTAAAMAMAYRIWLNDLNDPVYAQKCLRAAREIYNLGKKQEGVQQGNSYGSRYRYAESTWADDMEWGAAELFHATGEEQYLEDAIHYARKIGSVSWMGRDSTEHYQFYPFFNPGHYSLSAAVSPGLKSELAGYYRAGIEQCLKMSETSAFRIGVPFIWCSNNLVAALITQCYFYEKMTGDSRYHQFMTWQRDWLLGRNPWGTSMFVGIPEHGEFPEHPHASTYALTDRQLTGGLVDGPVYGSIFRNLQGLTLSQPDEFSEFQSDYVVYHDDIGDYATNEPTMDGTAAAILALTFFTLK